MATDDTTLQPKLKLKSRAPARAALSSVLAIAAMRSFSDANLVWSTAPSTGMTTLPRVMEPRRSGSDVGADFLTAGFTSATGSGFSTTGSTFLTGSGSGSGSGLGLGLFE